MRRVFYHIQRMKLPFPISLPELVIFAAGEALSVYLSRFAFYHVLGFWIRFILLPVGLAWVLSRMELEGRAPHLFFSSLIRYAIRPKLFARGKPIKQTPIRSYQLTKIVLNEDQKGKGGQADAATSNED